MGTSLEQADLIIDAQEVDMAPDFQMLPEAYEAQVEAACVSAE